jgi:hypothetical protein
MAKSRPGNLEKGSRLQDQETKQKKAENRNKEQGDLPRTKMKHRLKKPVKSHSDRFNRPANDGAARSIIPDSAMQKKAHLPPGTLTRRTRRNSLLLKNLAAKLVCKQRYRSSGLRRISRLKYGR